MRINPAFQNEIVSNYVNNATSVQPQTEVSHIVPTNDSVELSNGAQKYAELLRNARTALDTSEETEAAKAKEIAARMSAGTYEVSDDELATALMGNNIPDYC